MSANVKLSTALPGETEINGLDAQAALLVEQPETLRVGIAWYDVGKVTTDTDTGDQVPTIRFRRFEPLGDADTPPEGLRALTDAAIQQRTGRRPIPFEQGHVSEGYDPDQATIDDED